jgi:hypothetical protein
VVARLRLVRALLGAERRDDAAEHTRRALALVRDDPALVRDLARCYSAAGVEELGRAVFRESGAAWPAGGD